MPGPSSIHGSEERSHRAGACDDHVESVVGGGARVLVEHIGSAVSRHHTHLERDPELGEDVDRGPHDGEVGIASHDHADERVRHAPQASVTACAHD